MRELAAGGGREQDVRGFAAPLRAAYYHAVVSVQCHVVRDQKPHRRAGTYLDFESQLMRIVACLAMHLDDAGLVSVDPAAFSVRHLERRWRLQQMPVAAEFGEHTLSLRVEQTEIAAHGRQEPVDADVPLRDH